MGLDWLPGNRAKPGHEKELEEFIAIVKSGAKPSPAQMERYQATTEGPHIALGAPVVRTDAEADDFIRKLVLSEGESEAEAEATVAQNKGYAVLELAPESDGLPRYSSGGLGDNPQYQFNAEVLFRDCDDYMDAALSRKASTPLTPAELKDYGEALCRTALEQANGDDSLAKIKARALPDDDEEDGDVAPLHAVYWAGRWCLFWAERGYWLNPYF